MSKRVTLNDVATCAGVSYQTVSRVINDSTLVSRAVRARVREAMHELDYLPSAAARNLAGGRSMLLAVLISDVYNPFWGAILRGIEDVAYDGGYSMITCNIGIYDGEREATYVRVLREHRVAGVIIAGTTLAQTDRQLLAQPDMEVVSVDERRVGMDSVLLDNVAAADLAVEHLLHIGHRRIGLITGPTVSASGRGRLVGYRRALRRAGIPLDRSLQAINPFSQEAAAESTRRMLSRADRPSALIAASNDLTIGAMRAAASSGLRIPDDVALVGFDELTWTSALLSPITTVAQPGRALGNTACRLLLERLGGRYTGPPRRLLLAPRLIVSLSSGAMAAQPQDGLQTISEGTYLLHPLEPLTGVKPQVESTGSTSQRKEETQISTV